MGSWECGKREVWKMRIDFNLLFTYSLLFFRAKKKILFDLAMKIQGRIQSLKSFDRLLICYAH